MALTYVQQTDLANNVAWRNRIQAAAIDVALNTIRALAENAPNETQLKNLAVDVATNPDTYVPALARITASAGANANLATPPENTGTDAQLRTQVTAAFNALLRR